MTGQKIITGLHEAIADARGDEIMARVTKVDENTRQFALANIHSWNRAALVKKHGSAG